MTMAKQVKEHVVVAKEVNPTALSLDDVEVPEFDPVMMKVGKQIEQETAVLELHIGNPSFKKSINSKHFMEVLGKLSEDEISALTPEAKDMVAKFRAGTLLTTNGDESQSKTDSDWIHVSQDLLDRKAIKAIQTHDKRFTNWIKKHALPSPIRFQGAYLMRMDQVDMIDEAVLKYADGRKLLVNKMGDRWNRIIDNARQKRGPFFDESDYPPFSANIKPRYIVEARWLNFNVPAMLEKKNKEIFQRESQKARLFFADAAQEIRDAARVAARGLMENLLSQLGTDESGKKKRFMGGSVDKLQDFISMFLHGGDMTGDGELRKLLTECKGILANVDPAEIRKTPEARQSLLEAMKKVSEEASHMVVVSKRKFALDAYDEDEE